MSLEQALQILGVTLFLGVLGVVYIWPIVKTMNDSGPR